jgi:hypothetical protein
MTTTEPHCPVAALADEAQKLIDAKDAADKLDVSEREGERMMEAASRFLKGVVERSTFMQPKTAKGALFQLCVLSDLVDDLEGCVTSKGYRGKMENLTTPEDREAAALEKTIMRVIHSVAAYIEETADAKLEDACGDYFLSRDLSDHVIVAEALARAEEGQ